MKAGDLRLLPAGKDHACNIDAHLLEEELRGEGGEVEQVELGLMLHQGLAGVRQPHPGIVPHHVQETCAGAQEKLYYNFESIFIRIIYSWIILVLPPFT